ncbi:MAG: hypothetical protein CEN90_644 [Parcubacteria group bacterium Licking1014_17]|nr:MAG: hypothetical protein CEN90_644 [Parcubacteria group bacterium Licking1014_17]
MPDIERQTIETVKRVGPAVVSITASKMMSEIKKIKLSPTFWVENTNIKAESNGKTKNKAEPEDQRIKIGGGSGFVVDSNGLIMTNKHVVYDAAAEYTVVFSDESEHPVKTILRDPMNDVAFIKIDAKGLPTLELGDSDEIELGQTVIAVGNALGLFTNTVSKGIISGLGRKISAALGDGNLVEQLRHVIQTDVAINQGNSGGPLVNLDGEVVGINTAVIYGAQNIGFAIPVNWAKDDLNDLRVHGRIIKPFLGVRYIMLNESIAKKHNLPHRKGALVLKDHTPGAMAVVPGSPAEKVGLKEKDLILSINGTDLDEKTEVADVIDNMGVGDKIELTVLRDGETLNLSTVLEERR